MPRLDVVVECPVYDSFRVQQVAGMFDVPLAERANVSFSIDMPELGDAWQVGVIVGPSGSGKTTIARTMFGDQSCDRQRWPSDRAVVDCFGDRSIREITQLLTAVGFSSPPSWIKPYHVLSGGEQFRCDLARALVTGSSDDSKSAKPNGLANLVVFDEYTSVVDRNVARFGSAALAKGIRQGTIACRFIAVTCHYDVLRWLEPDWVLDMADCTFTRRRLRRPSIKLGVYRCKRTLWRLFAHHHYLSGKLNPVARCFVALWNDQPVAFCATLAIIGRKNHRRISRIVTLPDYQGLGIGTRMAEGVADLHRKEGHRMNITASHPSLIAHCHRSPKWRTVRVKKYGSPGSKPFRNYHGSLGRAVVSFEYIAA